MFNSELLFHRAWNVKSSVCLGHGQPREGIFICVPLNLFWPWQWYTLQILLFKTTLKKESAKKNKTKSGWESTREHSVWSVNHVVDSPFKVSVSDSSPFSLTGGLSEPLTCLVIGFNNQHSVAMGQNSNAGAVKNLTVLMHVWPAEDFFQSWKTNKYLEAAHQVSLKKKTVDNTRWLKQNVLSES